MNADTKINIIGGKISREEQEYYLNEIRKKNPDKNFREIEIKIEDDEYVTVRAIAADAPFERIRRITGYLVGTLDRFNNAKRAEESRRVKHSA